jgi:hypothetical protein
MWVWRCVVLHQMPHPYLRKLHSGNRVLVVNPYLIGGMFAIGASALELGAEGKLLPVALLAALVAGWSSAWSP